MQPERFEFEEFLRMLKSQDPMTQEDAYVWILNSVDDHVEELIDAFNLEDNIGIRSWLMELMSETRDEKCFDLYRAQLCSPDDGLRMWAIRGLKMLNSTQSRNVLLEARSLKLNTPEQTAALLEQLDSAELET